jgi:hypothetical protein
MKLNSSDHKKNLQSAIELLTTVLHRDHFHVEGQVKRWFVESELIEQMMAYPAEIWLPIFE